MRLIKLLILGAGAAFVYKRFFAGPAAGHEETQAAQPFSSEQLGDEPAPDGEPEAEAVPERNGDPLTQPTWLKPADA